MCLYGSALLVVILTRYELTVMQMEDPSVLDESNTLLDPNEPQRVAPLRLG